MKSYCFKCREDTENINPKVSNTSNGKTVILSKCAICGSKQSRFIKNKEAKGLLSNLGVRTPLSEVPILGDILSKIYKKMNKVVNKILLAGDKFKPEMHLKQPGFTYSACGPFTKNKERNQKFKETGDVNYIYKNELDKACFQHDTAYGDFKDSARRTASDKVLRDKAFNIAKNPKHDGYQRGLASIVYKCFDKKSVLLSDKHVAGSGVNIDASKSAFDNEKLAEEIHKPIIRKFKKRTVYSRFRDNIWGADLADMELINKFSKRFRFFLCVIDIFSKYAWVLPLKGKKGITITNPFQKILDGSNRRQSWSKGHKPKKIWVDKVSEFYNTSFKKWLKGNDIEMYLIHEGRSVVAERFIRLKSTYTLLQYQKVYILINWMI